MALSVGVAARSVGGALLVAFGPAVESRMGSKAFILYYFYCGVGAALLATGLSGIASVSIHQP